MKDTIHPKFYTDCAVTCACGNTFTTGSTVPKISVDICSNCHPFYTGTERLVDTEGRVDKFAKRQAQAKENLKEKKQKDDEKIRKASQVNPKTLKELKSEVEAQN
ncbi:MAG: 50S ribosomal protein L31 [Patescibacteria group bacterium]